jgi:hypothetical protein
MAIHKLATGPLTMFVEQVEQSEGNFGPQVAFKNTEVMVFISEKSASSQLKRLGLDYETAVGQTLYFEQVKKDGKTFTNIALGNPSTAGAAANGNAANGNAANAAPASAAPNASAVASVPAPKLTVPDAAKVYAECFEQAMAIVGAKCEAAEVPFSAQELVAAAATLFIRVMR